MQAADSRSEKRWSAPDKKMWWSMSIHSDCRRNWKTQHRSSDEQDDLALFPAETVILHFAGTSCPSVVVAQCLWRVILELVALTD